MLGGEILVLQAPMRAKLPFDFGNLQFLLGKATHPSSPMGVTAGFHSPFGGGAIIMFVDTLPDGIDLDTTSCVAPPTCRRRETFPSPRRLGASRDVGRGVVDR